jgi:aryl-alcohol dehydrogenase-like predicted oxidoreductase
MSSGNVQTRKLGQHGPTIPAIGLGLMGLSVFYGKPGSDEERFTLLDKALELGATHWDSAAYVYSRTLILYHHLPNSWRY